MESSICQTQDGRSNLQYFNLKQPSYLFLKATFKVDIVNARHIARISIVLARRKVSHVPLNVMEVPFAVTDHLLLKTHHKDLEKLDHTGLQH